MINISNTIFRIKSSPSILVMGNIPINFISNGVRFDRIYWNILGIYYYKGDEATQVALATLIIKPEYREIKFEKNVFIDDELAQKFIQVFEFVGYLGKIMGIGNVQTRQNEITADDLASERYYKVGWNYGVINKENYNFDCVVSTLLGNLVTVNQGIMFAYGYFGYADKGIFEFIRPSIPQYYMIYAELDRSQIPNICKIKVKNNQASIKIENVFRQDRLSRVKTGIFQLPLWRVKVGINGIEEIFDLRALRNKYKNVYYAQDCRNIIGIIDKTATATTQDISDNSKKIATTAFVKKAINHEIYKEWDSNYIQTTITKTERIIGSTFNIYFNAQSGTTPNLVKYEDSYANVYIYIPTHNSGNEWYYTSENGAQTGQIKYKY